MSDEYQLRKDIDFVRRFSDDLHSAQFQYLLTADFEKINQLFEDSDSYSKEGHKHTKSDITDFAHTHTNSEITGFEWRDKTDELNTAIQEYCTFEVNDGLRLACLSYSRGDLRLNTGTTMSNVGVPTYYMAWHNVRGVLSNNIYFTLFGVSSPQEGNIGFGNSSGSATTPQIDFQIMWHY